MSTHYVSGGLSFSNVAAFLLSWAQWKSIGWALVHGFFGIWYILFWLGGCTENAPLIFP